MSVVDKEKAREQAELIYRYMTAGVYREWGMDIHHWDWVPGVGVISILEYGKMTKQESVIRYLIEWVESNLPEGNSAKVINSMAPYAIFPDLYRQTGNGWYLEKAHEIARWMIEEAPRTRERAFEHTVTEEASFEEQVWA